MDFLLSNYQEDSYIEYPDFYVHTDKAPQNASVAQIPAGRALRIDIQSHIAPQTPASSTPQSLDGKVLRFQLADVNRAPRTLARKDPRVQAGKITQDFSWQISG